MSGGLQCLFLAQFPRYPFILCQGFIIEAIEHLSAYEGADPCVDEDVYV